ncbi:MAG TPA: hypothetical protein DCM10_20115 [Xanthomarina gelatinilytica]|nr:hypothetical protein [Xanthomarina gelatinilytica]|tara:strand:- start:789 stop:1085 length:297 start_codon:yes stop_codon:yes gene_type:complete
MTNDLISSLFFNPKEELKTRLLNADMVEATINQLIAELNQQKIRNSELIKVYKQENDLNDLAITEGVNKGLQIALIHLRKLNTDILWKQINMNINEND